MIAIRLSLAVLLMAGLVAANSRYEQIDTSDFTNRATAYQGRLVSVTGELFAVNADGKSIRVFDKQTRAIIDVQLNQMKKGQRNALILSSQRTVSVYGQVVSKNGKSIIVAHQVVPAS